MLLGIVLALGAVGFAACGGGAASEFGADGVAAPEDSAMRVIATTTILGDLVRNTSCGDVSVETVLGIGQDPHSSELSARRAAELRDADLIVANGLGLEETFADVLRAAGDSGTPVLFLAPELEPLPLSSSHTHERDEVDHDHEGVPLDPHFWMDPARMVTAARLIAAELSERTGSDQVACSEDYIAELERLDGDIVGLLEPLPVGSRKLVSNHDALGYFAERYRLTVVDTVMPGGATLAEPSAGDIVDLVRRIERTGVAVIFTDEATSTAIADIVAEETSPRVDVVALHTGSLGRAGSGAETYLEMMRTNTERIVAALSDAS